VWFDFAELYDVLTQRKKSAIGRVFWPPVPLPVFLAQAVVNQHRPVLVFFYFLLRLGHAQIIAALSHKG
jgi:hypothetical protein